MAWRAKALHAWDAEAGATEDDLTFVAGQEFDLVSHTEPGSGWMTGTINGKEGIFPGNYVNLVEVTNDAPAAAGPAVATAPVAAEASPGAEAENTPAQVGPAAQSRKAGAVSPAAKDMAPNGSLQSVDKVPASFPLTRMRTSGERELESNAAEIAAKAAATWEGKDDQERAAEEARLRRAAKKRSDPRSGGLLMELEDAAEEEDLNDEAIADVPMTPAERKAEWKAERQRTAEKAEAVARAEPSMLQSVDSERSDDGNILVRQTRYPHPRRKATLRHAATRNPAWLPGTARRLCLVCTKR